MLKLKDILNPEDVIAEMKASDRDGAVAELVEVIKDRVPMDKDTLINLLIEREEQAPTAMSGGVGVPHGRIPELSQFILAVGRKKEGIAFGAEEGKTSIFFLLMAPTDDTVTHLKILARIARICRNGALRDEILEAEDDEGIYRALMKEDSGS